MTFEQAIAYGLVQGLGEFLPISSSAHLALLPWFAGWQDPGTSFDAALHIGTLVVLLVYFRADLLRLARALLQSLVERRVAGADNALDRRLAWLVVIGSIPAGIAGVALKRYAETAFRAPWLIGAALAAMGLLLLLADRLAPQRRGLDRLTVLDGVLVGLAQAASIVPGVSRSGSTITAGRALRLDRESAARFSFLLAAPITSAAALLKLKDLWREGGVGPEFAVGLVVAGVTGWFAIEWLMRLVRSRSYLPFVVYRVVVGVGVIALHLHRAGAAAP